MQESQYWKRWWKTRVSRRRMLKTAGVAAIGVGGAALVGCGDGGDSEGQRTTDSGGESSGPAGTINVAVNTLQEMSSSPFFQTGGLSTPIFIHAFEGFYRIGPDGQPAPALASSVEVAEENPTTLIFKMREDATFWDGTPVTAEDAKWSFEAYVGHQPPAPPSIRLKDTVESVEAPDNSTVVVKFTKPVPFLMQEFGITGIPRGWPIASRAYYEKVGASEFDKIPMCTGPFRITKNNVGQFLELEANENYYEKGRIPRVKTVRLNIVPEQSTRLAQIRTGEADIIEGIVGPAAQSLQSDPDIRIVSTSSTALLTVRFLDLWDPNLDSPQRDQRFREALVLSVNQEEIAENLLKMGTPAPNLLIFPDSFGYNPRALPPRKRDVERAKSLIQEAGLKGTRVKLNAYQSSSYPLIPEVMQAYAGYWKEIGVEAEIQQQESGAYFTAWQEHALRGLGPISFPFFASGAILLVGYYKTGTPYGTTDNVRGLDELISQIESEFDEERQAALVQQALKIVYDGFYMIPAPYVDSLWATGPKIADWKRIAGMPYVNGLETVTLKG